MRWTSIMANLQLELSQEEASVCVTHFAALEKELADTLAADGPACPK